MVDTPDTTTRKGRKPEWRISASLKLMSFPSSQDAGGLATLTPIVPTSLQPAPRPARSVSMARPKNSPASIVPWFNGVTGTKTPVSRSGKTLAQSMSGLTGKPQTKVAAEAAVRLPETIHAYPGKAHPTPPPGTPRDLCSGTSPHKYTHRRNSVDAFVLHADNRPIENSNTSVGSLRMARHAPASARRCAPVAWQPRHGSPYRVFLLASNRSYP